MLRASRGVVGAAESHQDAATTPESPPKARELAEWEKEGETIKPEAFSQLARNEISKKTETDVGIAEREGDGIEGKMLTKEELNEKRKEEQEDRRGEKKMKRLQGGEEGFSRQKRERRKGKTN